MNEVIRDLKQLLQGEPWELQRRLEEYIKKLEKGGGRSLSQNNAMWLYLTMLSQELNQAGLPMQKVVKVDIDWDKDNAMKYLWKPILKAKFDKTSTRSQKKAEVSEVYEHLNRLTAEKWGLSIPFPNEEDEATNFNSQTIELHYPEKYKEPKF